MSSRAPLIFELTATGAPVLATGLASVIVGEVPEAGTLTEVSIIHATALASGTDYRIFTLFNRGTVGTGTVQMAAIAGTSAASGFVDGKERLATLGTTANLACAAGDVLELMETISSAGMVHNGYRVTAKVSRT